MDCNRRQWLAALGAGALAASLGRAAPPGDKPTPLRITGMRVTPIALPDPPLLAASGCHGPYYLRTIIEVVTADGVTGVGETGGGERAVAELKRVATNIIGTSALAYRTFPDPPAKLSARAYAAV